MIDERALQAAIPVGSNMANAELVRAIIEAYEAARGAEPVAAVYIPRHVLGLLEDGMRLGSAYVSREPFGADPVPLYTHPGAPNV